MPTPGSPTIRRRRCSLSTGAISPATGVPEAVEITHPAVDVGRIATEALGPEEGLLAGVDPGGFAAALVEVWIALARHPADVGLITTRHLLTLARAGWATAGRTLGLDLAGPVATDDRDRRFAHAGWQANPWFYGLRQSHLAWARYLHELLDAADVEPATADKAGYATDLVVDALAPTNFLVTNPAALRRAVDTGGGSLAAGAKNFLLDVATNGGMPRQVDLSPFAVGENLAATPGKVVFRNELIELIQYQAQTDTTYEVPLLLSPPWINKYYIMDLAPGRSFVEWAVTHGHTIFAISYRNPDESMRNVSLDDYLLRGPHDALDVIAEITGSDEVNIVGLCLGGTLTVMLMAHLAATGGERVRSATLLNTLVDFSEPGPMGRFLDRASVERMTAHMSRRGYLDSSEMMRMFDLLRARDLVWSYAVSGWLMGEQPPAFDILAWNGDGTRMPADMHSFYLRCCYVENQLARGEMSLAGTGLDLGQVTADTYVLSAKNDHIAPWRSSYKTTSLLGGDCRFVLSSSGHVAGIVNPPTSRRRFWTGDELPADPDAWLAGAHEHQGSWWHDWADWIATRAGDRRPAPAVGSTRHPPLADAPGTYVHQK